MDLESNDTPAPEPSTGTGIGIGKRRGRPLGCAIEIIETIVLTVLIFFIIQTFVAQPFQVRQRSMERTFAEGDYVLVDRLSDLWSPYSRGQVVVFEPPPTWTNRAFPFIKRVIAVGGDTIEVRDDGGVAVNGVTITEPYLFRNDAGDVEPTEAHGQTKWVVPDGNLFVMGDHRQESADSRAFGPIPSSSVVGRAVLRYWPLSGFGAVVTPSYEELPAS